MIICRTVGRRLVMGTRWLCYKSLFTIYGLSSGQGKAGIAVIRVSGRQSKEALRRMLASTDLPPPRKATLKKIRDPVTREILDKTLVLWFPGPGTFTGEDSFELHVHGSLAVIDAVLEALSKVPSLRLAEPGEFTKRAFMNGKLDLTEVEGLADLLDAETAMQRRQALLQSQGALSAKYNRWKDTIEECVCSVEAYIDFAETEDLAECEEMKTEAYRRVLKLHEEMAVHVSAGRKGEILREGVRVILIGAPNVGKSSIMNILSGKDTSIVTAQAGTTRDLIEIKTDIKDYPVILTDTAGLRVSSTDEVERIGIDKAKTAYEKADLVMLVIDSGPYVHWLRSNPGCGPADYIKYYVSALGLPHLVNPDAQNDNQLFLKQCLVVVNKEDLMTLDDALGMVSFLPNLTTVSCVNEKGFPRLLNLLGSELENLCGNPNREEPRITQARHRQHVLDCLAALEQYISLVDSNRGDIVMSAEHLRTALKCMGKLLGTVTTEDVLNSIFRRFCIGK